MLKERTDVEKPHAANPHVRFDEGDVALAATPRRGVLQSIKKLIRTTICICAATTACFCRGDGLPDGLVDINPNGGSCAVVQTINTPAFDGYARYFIYFSSSSASWLGGIEVTIGNSYTGSYLSSSLWTSKSLCTSYRISGVAQSVRLYVSGSCYSPNTTGRTRSLTCYIVEEDIRAGASSPYRTATYEFLIQQRSSSAPSNDSLADAITISGMSGSKTGSNTGATLQSSEVKPTAQGNSTGSVWYKWTAPSSGTATFDTVGSGFDTVLGVYTGTSVSALTEIGSSDDIESGNTKSRVTFSANSGTTYRIAVYGYNGANGSFTLNWSLASSGGGSGGGGSVGDAKYALCVGLNNYDMTSWSNHGWGLSVLNGCVNDATYFRNNLINRGGWQSSNVTKLTDSGATKAAIRNAIQSYAAKAVSGDTFIYQHSSHGLSYPDANGNYTKNVALAAYADPYSDSELASDLARFASGVKVVVIADTCHSGGLFKGVWSVDSNDPLFDIASRVSTLIDNQRANEAKGGVKAMRKGISSSEIGWVTAADYDRTSQDGACYDSTAWMDGDGELSYMYFGWPSGGEVAGGAFTAAMTWGWWTGGADTTSAGNGNGSMDVYEGFRYAASVLSGLKRVDLDANDEPILLDFNPPTYLNQSVLRSVSLGASGGYPTSPDLSIGDYAANGNASSITLSWSGAQNATSFNVYRSTSASPRPSTPHKIGVTSPYTDNDSLVQGRRYYYWIEAKTSSGSAFSVSDWGNTVLPLATALDNSSLSFSTGGGDASWWGQSDVSHDGVDAAHTGMIGTSSDSWLETTVFGAGTLSFWWKSSCEDDNGWYDYLEVLVDGTQKQRIKGETDWVQVNLTITGADSHVIRWNYHKDDTNTDGSDCGWVDQVAWTPSVQATQTVSFNANNGSCSVSTATYTIGGSYASPSLPTATRTGYTFAGWWTASSGGTQITASSAVSSSTTRTLYAHWTANTYTVTFNANGGSVSPATKTVTFDSTYGDMPTPTYSGHVFDGWYTSANGGTRITSSSKVTITSAQMLYAHWTSAGSGPEFTIDMQGNLTAVNLNGCTDIVIPDTVKTVGYEAFRDCTDMVSVTIPPSVTNIEDYAFYCCSALKNVAIPSSVIRIGNSAFDGCSSMATVTIGAGVEIIGRHAFNCCNNLTSVTLPARLKSIGGFAFASCQKLRNLTIPASVVNVGAGPLFACSQTTVLSVAAGNAVYEMVGGALVDKNARRLVQGPSGVEGPYVVPDGVDEVGYWALDDMNITELTLPASVVSLGDYALAWCNRLQSITFLGNAPTVDYSSTFYQVPASCIVYVPKSSSGWNVAIPGSWCGFDIRYLQTYAVTYLPGAHGTGSRQTATKAKDVALTLKGAIFTRTGYTQTGWATSDGGAKAYNLSGSYTANAAVTLYPYWTANTYTVTLDRQGGSGGSGSVTAMYGSAMPSITVPTRSGYTFGGYCTSTGGNGTQYYTSSGTSARAWNIAGAMTLYAKWTSAPTTYTVTFNANGGSGTMPAQTFADGVEQALAANVFEAPRWRNTWLQNFAGWATSANGPVVYSNGQRIKVSKNTTLYAVWEYASEMPCTSGEFDVAFAKLQTVSCALYRYVVEDDDYDFRFAGVVQVKAGKASRDGRVKISATAMLMENGKVKKSTAKALTVDRNGSMRGTLAFKAPVGDMTFEMNKDGEFSLYNDSYDVELAEVGGALENTSLSFYVDIDEYPDFGDGWELLEDALPDEVPITVTNGGMKWSLPKATTIKYKRFREDGDVWYELVGLDGEENTNYSGLKLAYTAKTGQFKGSFKMYATNEESTPEGRSPKLKKYTVNVIGFVVNGVGMGEACCKKPAAGPWTVEVE